MTKEPSPCGKGLQGRAPREPLKVWQAPLLDEGAHTALYPYNQLREILTPEDCRPAIQDEALPLEAEFGTSIAQPLYDLIWTLNTGAGVFTSHTVITKPGHPPHYDWAKHDIAVAIIILSRHHDENFNKDAVMTSVDELCRIISAQAPTQDYTGWHLSVGPCNVTFNTDMAVTTFRTTLPTDTRGFGIQLIIGGAANGRQTAATRWKNAVSFVNNGVRRTQQGPNVRPAAPHRHAIPGALPPTR